MKSELLKLITNSAGIDIPKMNVAIQLGQPYKLFGFISMGYESIGLFELHQGKNIFHYLAQKRALKVLLPKFFGADSQSILQREGITKDKLVELINSSDSSGYTPAHYASKYDHAGLQTLYKFGAVIGGKAYRGLVGVTNISPIEQIFRSEETANKFIVNALTNGFTEFFTTLCTEHTSIQRKFIDYLQIIKADVNKINTENAFTVFDVIFENFWTDILAIENSDSISKVMRLMNVLQERSPDAKGRDANKFRELSLEDWSNLLSKGAAYKEFKSYQEIKKYVLAKFAHAFLNNTLGAIKLSDLVNKDAISPDLFLKLQEFIDGVSAPYEMPVEAQDLQASAVVLTVSKESNEALAQYSQAASIEAVGPSMIQTTLSQAASVQEKLPPLASQIMFEERRLKMLEDTHDDKENARPLPNLPSASFAPSSSSSSVVSKKSKSTNQVTIQEYADTVLKVALGSNNCMAQINEDLGGSSVPLHVFISLASMPSDFFGRVLKSAAKKLNAVPELTDNFLRDYIDILEEAEFSDVNKTSTLDAYGLACARDQLNIAKLLLAKGWQLEIYNQGTDSIFESAIKHNSSEILKYLFTEQDIIEINWHRVILKAIKYANVDVINYYAHSDQTALENITDRRGNEGAAQSKYNVLNKALDSLVELTSLERFKNKPEQMKNAIEKFFSLSKCINIMIESGKIYYALDDQLVTHKTFSLIKELGKAIKKLPNYADQIDDSILKNLSESMIAVKSSVISSYKSQPNLSISAKVGIERLEGNIDDDAVSYGTVVSNFSILSAIAQEGHQYHSQIDTKVNGLSLEHSALIGKSDDQYEY